MGNTNYSRRPATSVIGVAMAVAAASGSSCSLVVETLDCKTNADCLAKSAETHCVHSGGASTGQCVRLRSAECNRLVGAWEDEDALLVGSVFPTTGPDLPTGLACQNAVEIAMSEFSTGLPAAPGTSKRRPLALVGCSDSSNPDQGVRAASHLAELGVQVVLGPQWSGVTRAIATQVTIPNDMLLISPSATAVSITSLVDKGLVWRTSPSDTYQGAALAKYVPLLEAQIRSERALPAAAKLKLLMVFQGTDYGRGLSEALMKTLVLNGASVSSTANAQYFDSFNYGSGDSRDTAGAATRVLSFKPDIVLNLCTDEGVNEVFAPVENQWPQGTPGPHWVFGDGGETASLWKAIGNRDELRRRTTGTVPGTNNSIFQTFKFKYDSRHFNDGTDPAALGPAGSYDSLHLVAYSAASLGSQPLTGPNLATGLASIDNLSSTTVLDISAQNVEQISGLLQAGKTINVNGASGPLDFDLETGEAPSDIQVWCMPKDAQGNARSAVFSNLYLDAATMALNTDKPDATVCMF